MRRFKAELVQITYDWFLQNDPGPETRGKGSAHNAYYIGRHVGRSSCKFVSKGSPAYAAWAAGQDNARKKPKLNPSEA